MLPLYFHHQGISYRPIMWMCITVTLEKELLICLEAQISLHSTFFEVIRLPFECNTCYQSINRNLPNSFCCPLLIEIDLLHCRWHRPPDCINKRRRNALIALVPEQALTVDVVHIVSSLHNWKMPEKDRTDHIVSLLFNIFHYYFCEFRSCSCLF